MEKAVRRGEVWKGLVREGGETELNSWREREKGEDIQRLMVSTVT